MNNKFIDDVVNEEMKRSKMKCSAYFLIVFGLLGLVFGIATLVLGAKFGVYDLTTWAGVVFLVISSLTLGLDHSEFRRPIYFSVCAMLCLVGVILAVLIIVVHGYGLYFDLEFTVFAATDEVRKGFVIAMASVDIVIAVGGGLTSVMLAYAYFTLLHFVSSQKPDVEDGKKDEQ